MYEEYYGFAHAPFSLTPDPRFLYRSESHGIALQQVWQAIRRKEGFIVLTGEIGTGKTTLARAILGQVEPTTFTALLLDPLVSVEELLREVLVSFGVASRETLRNGRLAAATRHELVRTLHDFLLSLVPFRGSAVLIIDEAQHLSPDVLEEIRLLSNLETEHQKLLQIVLVGQLNLLDVLEDAKLRQLDQRISIRCLLKPLNREEAEAYIAHRLWVARGTHTVSFDPAAVSRVHAISGGLPRVINLLCDRALMAGAEAKSHTITESMVVDAAAALGLRQTPFLPEMGDAPAGEAQGRRPVAAVLAALLLGAAAVGTYLYASGQRLDSASLPAIPAASIAPALLSAPPPAATLPSLDPPPLSAGPFSVLVDTYEDPASAETAQQTIRDRKLPLYAIDLRFPDGVRRRLLFVGRFRTRDEADAARSALTQRFPDARVVLGSTEPAPRPDPDS